MPDVQRDDFTIHYEVTRPGDGPTLLLVAGLGEQIGSVEYPEAQCDAFAAQGFCVVRMDNRDCGLSVPDGEPGAYTLHHMADDAVAVLDDLGVARAHLLGASLGGFIVRWIALRQPARVASLTVVMSGSAAAPGEDGPQVDATVAHRLLEMAERRDRSEAIELQVDEWRWLWGRVYPFDEAWVRARVEHAYERAYRPEGIGRLLQAAVATPGLWDAQSDIRHPTLVVHGGEDPCFPPDHARATAERIPGAQLWLDPGMGHIMHREQWVELAERVRALADRDVAAR